MFSLNRNKSKTIKTLVCFDQITLRLKILIRNVEFIYFLNLLSLTLETKSMFRSSCEVNCRINYICFILESVWNWRGNLLCVWRAACTKHGWSDSFSSSWVNAISPACSIRLRLSATWADKASPRFCRAASRACVREAWRSARAAVRSRMLWASCSLADTLFTWSEGWRDALVWRKSASLWTTRIRGFSRDYQHSGGSTMISSMFAV